MVFILSGDIDLGTKGIEWAAMLGKPVIYVLGNHEHYQQDIIFTLRNCREIAAMYPNVHLLENDYVDIAGVRFHGCTYWTDYNLYGYQQIAMSTAEEQMADHKAITYGASVFKPSMALAMHETSKKWLYNSVKYSTATKNVIVTHHAPSKKAIASKYRGSLLSGAFASDIGNFAKLSAKINLWFFGHTHQSCNFVDAGITFTSNQLGYPRESCGFSENNIIDV